MEETFKKNDQDKPDFTLIPQEALLEVSKVFTFGAKKYGRFNYSNATTRSRYIAAALRHINQYLRNEDLDDETSISHLAHATASLMMGLDAIKLNKGEDDRNTHYPGKKVSEIEEKDIPETLCACQMKTPKGCDEYCVYSELKNSNKTVKCNYGANVM